MSVAEHPGIAVSAARVMQAPLDFADAADAVLSPDDLMRRCWPLQIVGDDATNRAVAEVGKAALPNRSRPA